MVDAVGGMRGLGSEKRKIQLANPTAMLHAAPLSCKFEGVAFEVLACLAGIDPKIAQKNVWGSQKLMIPIFGVGDTFET